MTARERLPLVVLISGHGSNLQAILDAIAHGLPVEIKSVISNERDAFGIERAQQANIPTHVVPHRDFSSQEAFEQHVQQTIDSYSPKLVVLAGFMRKLSPRFASHYHGRMINIHPSLLPKHKGLHAHRQVLEAGETEHGASVHYVTEDVDGGPIICQAKLAVRPEDTEETLKARVHELEHVIYPQVLAWIAAGRLTLQDHRVLLDNRPLPPTGFVA